MTDRRRRERTLPEGYQFGDAAPSEHLHVFNSISGYCACGLQYLPHLLPYFEHGGAIGDPPRPGMDDTRPRFVTVLPPGASIETAKLTASNVVEDAPSWRSLHLNAADRLARHAGWNVIEGEHFDSDAERHPVIEGTR